MTKSATILTSTMNEERHFTIPYTGTENWDLCKCCLSSNLPNFPCPHYSSPRKGADGVGQMPS